VNAPRKLALFAAALAGVLGIGMAVGYAAEPVGLSNAEPEEAGHGGSMPDGMIPGLAAAEAGFRLVPERDTVVAGENGTYRFHVDGEDGTVREFDIEHTKPMHLIVVRRDFEGFQHLHPEMDATGTWSTPLTIDEAGAYRVYADFVVDGDKHTLATDLFVAGDFRPRPLPRPEREADAGDGYTVHLDGDALAGEESELDFRVTHDGRPVDDLEEYLGARGHLVALRDGDLAYLHVHADEERLSFESDFPTPGAYRLFLQFRHDGEVRTAAFTVDVAEESR
jgi:hypothetical protein